MTKSLSTEVATDQPTGNLKKIRQCLRCQTTFHSDWAGERICSRCKKTAAWREGAPLNSGLSGNRR